MPVGIPEAAALASTAALWGAAFYAYYAATAEEVEVRHENIGGVNNGTRVCSESVVCCLAVHLSCCLTGRCLWKSLCMYLL